LNSPNVIFEFGSFRLEGRERRLRKGAASIALQPKVFDMLLLLVENAGHVLTKDDLMASLWGDTAVEEGNLAKNVWLIRRALGEAEGENRYIETVPKAGYRFVAPVRTISDPLPAELPAATTDSAPGPARAPEPARARPRRRRGWLAAAGGVLLALAAFVGWMENKSRRIASTAGAPPPAMAARRSVAVLGFQDLSGRPESGWLSTAVSEMLSAEIAAGEQLRLVPAENVARLTKFRRPDVAGTLSRDTLAGLRSSLGADLVLSGSYVVVPSPGKEALRFDVTLQDSASGNVLATVTETGNATDLFALVSSAGGKLRSRLGLAATSPTEADRVAASLPKDPEGTRLYAEGLGRLRSDDALGARPLLEASVRETPDFEPAHEALSRAWSALGYDQKAREEASKAFRLVFAASPPIRASAEARLAETEKNWARAESLNASIFRSHPDDPDAGLRLASAQIAGGRAREALLTLAALGRLAAPARDDARIDLARADASAALSKWPEELAASRAAAAKAQRNGSSRMLAEARLHEAGALGALGDPDRGRRAYEEARRLFRGDGDSKGEADALIGIANAADDQGREAEAESLYRQAQATFERIGNRKGEARALSDLADLHWLRGDVDSTLFEGRRVLAINRDIDDPRGIIWGLTATGNVLVDQGDFEQALMLQEEGLGISRRIGDEGSLAYGLGSVADTFLAEGRLEDARRNYEKALALSTKLGDPAGQAAHEMDLGNVFTEEGRFSDADREYARALALRKALGVTGDVAESQMLIASLRNVEGRYPDAARLADDAARAFGAARQTGNAAIALANQARAELGLGRLAEARSLCARARAQLKANRQNGANFPVLLEAVRIETAASNLEAARSLLEDIERRTRKAPWLFYVLEARRAEAEIDIRAGRRRDGLNALKALAEEAGEKGFALVAAEARTVIGSSTAGAP
jgi:DNA-binding winged helix-turn-helix (wHTH) protein/tetratricopeptide (TPR) repeat protein